MNASCIYLEEIKLQAEYSYGQKGREKKNNGYIIFGLKHGKIQYYPIRILNNSD